MARGLIDRAVRMGEARQFKECEKRVDSINRVEPEMELLDDSELREDANKLRERARNGESLEELMPEAFALGREAARRTIGQRHFNVQLIGAMVLHDGAIAEMKTGEGKTLTATLPIFLNSLAGTSVHLVTVNDYLARRDAEWMGPIYEALGVTVGVIQESDTPAERREAYACDVVYGTNSEFGFDYLRDNMAGSLENTVQRGHHFAIVDEVDNILIDEARTPLIISGAPEQAADLYYTFARLAKQLVGEETKPKLKSLGEDRDTSGADYDYEYDEKHKTVAPTERGVEKAEKFLGVENLYVSEHGTLATITLQNYFRLYDKLAGMTGTALTEATEFMKIYEMPVVEIPTNVPMVRDDHNDQIYKPRGGKWKAAAAEITERHQRGQPILVGTISVEISEMLSDELRRSGVEHVVLNAKPEHAQREGETVAQAGRLGAVTIATNMAARGGVIKLGGDPEQMARHELRKKGIEPGAESFEEALAETLPTMEEQTAAEGEKVVELGGLFICGTERHESRRIDNQLRGRSGRQGDPGESRFFLSLEDDLMRLFASDRIAGLMSRMKIPDDVPIEAKLVSKAIERAQTQVESMHFETRKNVLKYDEVMDKQRQIIYGERRQILEGQDFRDQAIEIVSEVVASAVA